MLEVSKPFGSQNWYLDSGANNHIIFFWDSNDWKEYFYFIFYDFGKQMSGWTSTNTGTVNLMTGQTPQYSQGFDLLFSHAHLAKYLVITVTGKKSCVRSVI